MTPHGLISVINAVLWLLVLAGGAALGMAFSSRTGLELVLVGISAPLLIVGVAYLLRLLSWAFSTGFSPDLIAYRKREAAIGVAILVILSAVVISTYRDYRVRSNVSQALDAMAPAKRVIENYFAGNRAFPATLAQTHIASAPGASALREVRYDNSSGALTAVFAGEPIDGKSVAITPVITQFGSISWTCKTVDLPAKYLPDPCP